MPWSSCNANINETYQTTLTTGTSHGLYMGKMESDKAHHRKNADGCWTSRTLPLVTSEKGLFFVNQNGDFWLKYDPKHCEALNQKWSFAYVRN